MTMWFEITGGPLDGHKISTDMFGRNIPAEGERFSLNHGGKEHFHEIHDDTILYCGEDFEDDVEP